MKKEETLAGCCLLLYAVRKCRSL